MADIYNIGEFLGIAQHRDGSLLNTGTAIDARNMDTSDGNLSVAKGYVRKSGNAIPYSAGQTLRIIPVDESNILAVTQNSIYHGTYDTWNLTPIYTFETTLPVTCQIGYALGKINTTNVVVIGTGKTQLIKVNMGDTVTAEIFGSGLYIFETTVSAYDSATKIVTLADAMSQDIQQKFVVEKGVYIDGRFREAEVTTATTITLKASPAIAPAVGNTVKLRGGASDAHCNFVCMHNGRLFAAGDPDAPNRLYWSTIPGDGRTIEHWLAIESSVDLSGGYVEVGDTTADPIIGICELSTQILIFKRYSIYRLYGDRPSYYTVERVEKFTENMSNAGVAVKTDIPYWLTKSGIKLFNGADMQLLDGGQNYLCSFIDTIKTVSQSKAFTANGKLYFTCRVGSTGTYDDSVIVYDTVNGTYMVRDGFKIADMCAFENTIYLINDTGYLYEFDKGEKYDGQAISAYWQTQPTDLTLKYVNKQLKEVYFRAGNVGSVIILETFNGNSRNRERRVIQNDDMIDLPMSNQPCRRFSIKLSNEAGSHFTIYGGIQIQYEGKMRPV